VEDSPLSRASPAALDRLMATLDIEEASLSECVLQNGSQSVARRLVDPGICYILEGSCTITVDSGPPINAGAQTLILIPPNRGVTVTKSDGRHAALAASLCLAGGTVILESRPEMRPDRSADAVRFVHGRFRAVYGPGLDLFASLSSPIVEAFGPFDHFCHLMDYGVAELRGAQIGRHPTSNALVKLLLLALLRRSLVSPKVWVECFSVLGDQAVARAFAEMASRPSAPHTVDALSQTVGLSRSAFMARFSAAIGASPMAVLRRIRMRHAATLLAANALSIDRVALQAGYRSRSSFSRMFREHYGMDPSAYRENVQAAAGAARNASGSVALDFEIAAG
jgi:AraC family transcriptional activator of mtrCDE